MSLAMEHWKKRLENAKRQLDDLKKHNAGAFKNLDQRIASQTNPEAKKRARAEKASRKEQFVKAVEHYKKTIEQIRREKPTSK